jgi:glycosyltransferase involved in cell wall biosynthesis
VDGKQYPNYEVIRKLQEDYNTCDLFHVKDDQGLITKFLDIEFNRDIPVVSYVTGSVWRSYHTTIYPQIRDKIAALTVTTPDLLFYYPATLVQFGIDLDKYKPIPKSEDCIIVGHSPSNTGKKGTEDVLRALNEVRLKHSHVYGNINHGLPHVLTMELKRLNHIFIDQIGNYGIYANSAVEAMALGSVVIADVDNKKTPIVHATPATITNVLLELVENPELYQNYLNSTLSYVQSYHSYQAVCKKIESIYDNIFNP